jgi:hypothetical protein
VIPGATVAQGCEDPLGARARPAAWPVGGSPVDCNGSGTTLLLGEKEEREV